MNKLSATVVCSALLSIFVLAHFVFAVDRQVDGNDSEAAGLLPGTKCVVTAQFECEIHEVNEEEILVAVTAIRRANQNNPVFKVPYVKRVFKNTGVRSSAMDVIVRIPKDRIKMIEPIRAKAKSAQ